MKTFCRNVVDVEARKNLQWGGGKLKSLTANAKPHTALGLLIHLKYTICSEICVSAAIIKTRDRELLFHF